MGCLVVYNLSGNDSKASNKLVLNEGIPDNVNRVPIQTTIRVSNTLMHAAACIFHEHMGSRNIYIDHRSLLSVHVVAIVSLNIEFAHVFLIFQISLLVLVSSQVAPFTAFLLASISC